MMKTFCKTFSFSVLRLPQATIPLRVDVGHGEFFHNHTSRVDEFDRRSTQLAFQDTDLNTFLRLLSPLVHVFGNTLDLGNSYCQDGCFFFLQAEMGTRRMIICMRKKSGCCERGVPATFVFWSRASR